MLTSLLKRLPRAPLTALRHLRGALLACSLTLVALYCGSALAQYNLPELGDASSAVVSPYQERELGQTWLRLYRSRVPTSSDPLIRRDRKSVV